jgi:hypothetical protein
MWEALKNQPSPRFKNERGKAEEGLTGPLFQTDVAGAKWGFPEPLLIGQ